VYLNARLAALLGTDGSELTEQSLQRLVDARAREDSDLEFKGKHYPKDKNDELAKDVAAMLNAAGGLLIIGILEDRQARATSLTPVSITDGDVRRIREVVAENVRPFANLDIQPVPASGGPDDHGYLVVSMPRSPVAPHSVRRSGPAMTFPIRNGETTRFLNESELGEHYRRRFATVAGQSERLGALDQRVQRTVHRETEPWLMIVAVPDVPGDLPINRAELNQFQRRVQNMSLMVTGGHSTFRRFGVGPRRLWADSSVLQDPRPAYGYLELNQDGSGAFGLYTSPVESRDSAAQGIHLETLVLGAMRGLPELARGARRANAGQSLALRVRVLDSPATAAAPLQLLHWTQYKYQAVTVALPPGDRDFLVADTTASTTDLEPEGAAMMKTLATLLNGLHHGFGSAEQTLITEDGQINANAWDPHTLAALQPWLSEHSVKST
jgi:hypothetical protein